MKLKKKQKHFLACYLDGSYCYCYDRFKLSPSGYWARKSIYKPTSIKDLTMEV